ncbi:hypothetical protein EV356DRAFT_559975 [Viridothelium virens]|uniref:Serine/threonine-protein kinase Tel1 n=1 Tax=Viridothelium virens TaxID=1048519 RepID=A0A6A6H5K2_VIRVR|nr:hypothetical protein EV356DRAFT_559975 [Viridothelium virens]
MAGVDIPSILDQVKSSSVKERNGGLDALKEVLSQNRRSGKVDPLKDAAFYQIFEALFHFASLERKSYLEATRAQVKQLSGRRLENCASVLRLVVETGVTRIRENSVCSLLKHIVQMLPVADSGYCEPLISDYLKCLRKISEHPAHVEHLPRDLWNHLVDFCVAGLCHAEDESGTKISFGSFGRTPSSNTNGLAQRSSHTSGKASSATTGKPSLSARDVIEVMAIFKQLTLAPNAPIKDQETNILGGILSFLNSTRERGLLSKTTSAHHDGFAVINSVLARTRHDNEEHMLETLRQLIPLIKEMWTSKESALNQEILIYLVYVLDHIPLLLNADNPPIDTDIESLVDVLYGEYSRRPERDSLGQLQLSDLGLSLGPFYETEVFRTGTFYLRTGQARSEMQWSIVYLIAELSASQDYQLQNQQAEQVNAHKREDHHKKPKTSQHLHDFLRRTKAPGFQQRLASLQVVIFRLCQRPVHEDDLRSILEKLLALASDENSEISTWAMVGLSSCAWLRVSAGSEYLMLWTTAWQLAIRQFTSTATCRAACHLAESLLRLRLVSHSVTMPALEAVISSTNLHGPALLTDSSSTLLSLIVKMRSSESRTAFDVTSTRVLQWLQAKWTPGNFNIRSYASEAAHHSNARDVLRLLYACTDRAWQEDVQTHNTVLGHVCQAWLHRHQQYPLTSYLLNKDNVSLGVEWSSSSLAKYQDSDVIQGARRLASVDRDGALLDFCLSQLAQATDALATYSHKPQDINADMIRLLTSLCLVATEMSCVEDFQDTRRLVRLSEQTQILSTTVAGLMTRSDFDEKNVNVMMEVICAYAPAVFAVFSLHHPPRMLQSLSNIAKIFSSSLEERCNPSKGDGLDDDLDVMDVDSGMESQASHLSGQTELMNIARSELAARNDAQSQWSSTAVSIRLYASLQLSVDSIDSHLLSSSFVDYLIFISPPELLACGRMLLPVLQSGVRMTEVDLERFLDHFATECLMSYEYERCEVALSFCLELLTSLTTVWTNPSIASLFDDAIDMYGWFVNTGLPGNLLSPNSQVKLADLLVKLLGYKVDFGTDENIPEIQELNLPSVRTTLFSILKVGELPVKDHVIALIPEMFNLFVLSTHENIFADVQASLPDDTSWPEGMALRLLAFTRLGSRWHTLLRRCVYSIFETAGAMPSPNAHAKFCTRQLTQALSLGDSRALFKLFAPQLLFTGLRQRSIKNIPFGIFEYSTLEQLLVDNREEITAQLLMHPKREELDSLASLLETTPYELVLNCIGKVTAYCLMSDISEMSSDREKNIREKTIKEIVGKDVLISSIKSLFPSILADMLALMQKETEIGKAFQKRADLQYSSKILNMIKMTSSSNALLPHDQQPLFKSRIVLDGIDRLCHRANVELPTLWKSSVLVYVLRSLFDAIYPALGSLHACSVIRKARVVLCLAGDVALEGYPLEMLLQTLRPFLTDQHCAEDTLGIVQYLFAYGKSSLVERPYFLARIALLILISLRAFLLSEQDSTTQESQYRATMNKAQSFHRWFCAYLEDFPIDNVAGSLQQPFRTMIHAACQIRKIGNAARDSAESYLLRELLSDENRSPSLVDRPSRDNALHMLCREFELPDIPNQDLFASDADAVAYSTSILRICQRVKVSDEFLLWSARLLGRTFASQGQIENYGYDHRPSFSSTERGQSGLSESKNAIVKALLDLFQSEQRQQVSYAERTIRIANMRFHQFRDPGAILAFEQLLPCYLHQALNLAVRNDSSSPDRTPNWSEIRASLRESLPECSQTDAQTWIQRLTIALAHAAAEDALLGALPLILSHAEELAERIFPFVLHEVLLLEKGRNERVRQEISSLCEKWFKRSSKEGNVHVEVLLRGLLYLRTQPVPDEETPAARDQWLSLDYLAAAQAASRCGMYETALLLTEITTPLESGRSRRSSTIKTPIPNDLLLEVYTNISDPDAFYGVEQQPSLDTVMIKAEHESNGFKSLLYRGARLDSQLRRDANFDATDYRGILQALNRLNVNSITQSLVNAQQGHAMDENIAASLLDTARRLEQWDLRPPDSAKPPSATLFKTFQTLNTGHDQSLILRGLDSGLLECMRGVTSQSPTATLLHGPLGALAVLTETSDVMRAGSADALRDTWSNMQSRQGWMPLGEYEDVRQIMSCRVTTFSSVSKNNELQRIIPLSLRGSRTIELEALLASSAISRKHDAFQDSLSATTHLINLTDECQKCGIEVGAARTIELANVLWDQGEMMSSIKLLKSLQGESNLGRQDIPVSKASLLAQLGYQVAEARLEKPDEVIKSYLNPAVEALGDRADGKVSGQVFHTFATFCDQQLQSPDGREDFERVKTLRNQKHTEMTELQKMLSAQRGSSSGKQELKHNLKKAQQWFEIDNQEYMRLRDSRSILLGHSLENYLRTLARSDTHDNDVLRFFALWLENADASITNESVERNLAATPSWKFVILMNQLSSRIQDEDSKFQSLLQSLVLRICTEHPYHGMYHIYAGMKTPGGKDESAISRNSAAKKLAGQLEKSPSRKLWKKIFQTNECFGKLACSPTESIVKKYGKKFSPRHMPEAITAGETAARLGVPPTTMDIEVRPSGSYEDIPKMVRFDSTIQVAGGLSAPMILKVIATDGRIYKQLYKGGTDELRQDAIMEQVFAEVSNLMRNHRETRRRNLRIRTYKVVPLGHHTHGNSSHSSHTHGKNAGIIEFVQNSVAFHEFLIPGHERYHPKDLRNDAARKKIAEVAGRSPDEKLAAYRAITARFSPVMRFFFLERFTDPDEWFTRRLAYTRSTAAISILGHVLGLGDRHLHNILLDERSGEVVHIDLGVAFETGRVLPMPEVVPFRLTRDVVDGMGITGVEGVFRRCCEFMLDALRREQSSIMTLLNVLRYDPLYSWSVSPLKAKQMQDAQSGASRPTDAAGEGGKGVSGGREESRKKNDAGEADRALSVVQRKLNKTLSTTATVNELIQQATDERNLAMLFQGWCAWA